MAAPCGTPNGYNAHAKSDEEPCQPCRDAWAKYMRNYRTSNKARLKRAARAHELATRRLIAAHQDEFDALLAEEEVA